MKKLGIWVIRRFCRPELVDDLIGDLEELHSRDLVTTTNVVADFRFLIAALLLLRPSLLRSFGFFQTNATYMIDHHIKSSFRNMARNKMHTAINVLGLTIGIAATISLYRYIEFETSYDNYYRHADRIYRVTNYFKFGDRERYSITGSGMLAPAIKENLTGVELAGRIHMMGNVQVEWGDKRFKQLAYYADPSLAEILELNFLYGQSTALAEENQVVLSESLARKIFDDIDVVGQLIELQQQSMRVAGVYRDIPSNSHKKSDMLVSMVNMGSFSWERVGHVTYVRLEPGMRKEVIDERLTEMVADLSIAEPESGIEINFSLYPVKEIYLSSDPAQEGKGSRTMIYVLSSIAIFLLLIASINYINMATARASSRSREIGVRKVIGADRIVLICQFLVEAYVVIFISIGLGLGLAILLVDELIVLTGLPTDFQLIHGQLLFMIFFLGLILGLVAGLYPAYVLSSFQPKLVSKGMNTSKGGKYLRRILVTFQFTMSVILILCTLVVLDQIDYIRNKDLGYNREGIYALTLSESDPSEILKSELLKLPEIKGVTATNLLPATGDSGATFEITNESGETSRDIISMASIDADYQDVMEINLIRGEGISEESGLQSVVVNETLVAKYSWKDPIGKNLNLNIGEKNESFRIIGVVQDFNMLSLHEDIKPFAFFKKPKFDWGRQYLLINLSSNDLSVSLDRIRSIFERYDPEHLFQGRFLEDHLNRIYQDEQQLSRIFMVFAMIAIVIAGLGLFGLATYMMETRTREISIRKVLGANVFQILKNVTSEFFMITLVSGLLAIPVAWYAMSDWLAGFSFHTTIQLQTLIAGILSACLVALIATSFHIWRLTRLQPAETLKEE